MAMKNKIAILISVPFFFANFSFAQNNGKPLENSHYTDPVYEDYVETLGNYLNKYPKSDFRDSPTSAKSFEDFGVIYSNMLQNETKKIRLANLKKLQDNSPYALAPLFYKVKFPWEGGPLDSAVVPINQDIADSSYKNYVFVKVTVRDKDYSVFRKSLGKISSFKFSGKRDILNSGGKTVKKQIFGWIPLSRLNDLLKNPLALKTSIEKKSLLLSKTKISFLVKLPYYVRKNLFLSAFLSDMKKRADFTCENTSSIAKNIIGVSGDVPLDKVDDIYRSPFVLQLKITDN